MASIVSVKSVALAAVACCFLASGALADATCKSQAEAKSLHGAAQTSFLNKCEKDARAKCDSDSKAKGLHGAAETSFKTKCMKDAGA